MNTKYSTPLPNLIPSCAIYRVHLVRKAVVAGVEQEVIGEQVGGDYSTRAAAEEAAEATGKKCSISHVGGRE